MMIERHPVEAFGRDPFDGAPAIEDKSDVVAVAVQLPQTMMFPRRSASRCTVHKHGRNWTLALFVLRHSQSLAEPV